MVQIRDAADDDNVPAVVYEHFNGALNIDVSTYIQTTQAAGTHTAKGYNVRVGTRVPLI